MISLISSMLGFIGAMVPELISFLKDREDKKHELKILDLQLKQQAQGSSERLEEIRIQGDSEEMRALYQTYATGIHWVDALNGTVRPVLAYSFFLLYGVTKLIMLASMPEITANTPLGAWLPMIWGEEDQAIFSGIISFYFGQRAFQKMKRQA